ncbi:MAG: hypothetical protein Q8O82_16315 [Pseudorhodobacter sp.]|nr:hypothetical protein [Pseudorhodobacter sp.]
MDIARVWQYIGSMGKFASRLAIVVLAVFAASATVQAVSADAMALADGGTMAMADCQGCAEDGNGIPDAGCELVCTAPVIAAMNSAATPAPAVPVLSHDRPIGMTLPHGLRAPPDPFPPRTLI